MLRKADDKTQPIDQRVLNRGLAGVLRPLWPGCRVTNFDRSLVGPSPRAAAKGGRKAQDDASLTIDLRTGFWIDHAVHKSGLGARSLVAHVMDVPLDEAVDVLLHELHRAPGSGSIRPLTAGRAQGDDLNKGMHPELSPFVRKELLYEAAKRHAPHHR